MWNALVVVWRESLEAMLVIGVLLSWIGRQSDPAPLKRGLWSGVAAGVALAGALGAVTYAAQSEFAGEMLERFQLAMVLVAAALILHMVLWMHGHGRHMKRELERQADQAVAGGRAALGLAAIAALAVAREGAETVIFLYGLGMEGEIEALLGGAIAGFALAGATAWIVARGARFLSMRALFRASEFLLLLIATALLAAGIDRMIGMEWLPPLVDPLWDIADILPDARGPGRFLADFFGYRARPAATLVLAIAAFWAYAFWRMARIDRAGMGRA